VQEATNFGFFRSDPMKFTGHDREYYGILNVDNNDYIDYMHARYYNPNQGRFLSVDPVLDAKAALRNPQSWNRYAYVVNNPLRYTDPTGKLIWLMGTNDNKKAMLEALRAQLMNQKAAQYLTVDKFNRLTITGMTVSAWAKQFGGNAAKLGSMMQSSYKLGVGFSGDAATQKAGGGLFLPTGANSGQVTIDRAMFPQTRFGTPQWTDTTLAHELFGHGMSASVGIHDDVGRIHPGMSILYGIGSNEADGMWAENQWRAQMGDPLRAYYFQPGDYIPPGH
jgi:RHS repeat-associated protein